MNETFFHFFSCLIRMIVCWFTFSSFFLSFFDWEREEKQDWLIDWWKKQVVEAWWIFITFLFLIDWLIEISFISFFTFEWMNKWIKSTDDNGYLGSCIDEERSKVRKAMWIAQHVNHQIFERIWRLGSCFQACLFESRFHNCKLFLLFFHSFTFVIDWLIWKRELFVVCFIWFHWLIDWNSDEMNWESHLCLFVCFTHFVICVILIDFWIAQWNCKLNEWMKAKKDVFLFQPPTNQPMNQTNFNWLWFVIDWLIVGYIINLLSLIDWLIDVCDGLNEFESLIDWLIVVVNWEKLACFLLSILSSILSFILFTHPSFVLWPQIRQDYLLNLSI